MTRPQYQQLMGRRRRMRSKRTPALTHSRQRRYSEKEELGLQEYVTMDIQMTVVHTM